MSNNDERERGRTAAQRGRASRSALAALVSVLGTSIGVASATPTASVGNEPPDAGAIATGSGTRLAIETHVPKVNVPHVTIKQPKSTGGGKTLNSKKDARNLNSKKDARNLNSKKYEHGTQKGLKE
jgi:hypothetical protein